jgi:ABC-type sugar transport system ATPase subunit
VTNSQSSPIAALVGVHKKFGAITAVESFDLELFPNEVVALVGDNGAGKSTLIKTIAGIHAPTRGHIELHGEKVSLKGPKDARAAGIEVVYQDLALATLQPVYMNLFLGRELVRKPWGLINKKEMQRQTQALVDELDVRVPSVSAPVNTLSGGQRQAIAICRATHWASSIVLLDEPTAALGVAETKKVEELVIRLKNRGAAVLLVSHNMDQVFRLADRVVVLRRGKQIGVKDIRSITQNELVAMITGVADE